MNDDKVTTVPDEGFILDRAIEQARRDGVPVGVLAAIDWLHDQAVLHFRTGRDADAVVLRNIASKMTNDLLPRVREDGERYATEFPARIRKGDTISAEVTWKVVDK